MLLSLAVVQMYGPLTNIRFTFALACLILLRKDMPVMKSVAMHCGIMHVAPRYGTDYKLSAWPITVTF